MATDLEKAYEALKGKNKRYRLLWDYYHGNHPLVYSSERLREVFRDRLTRFTENWCGVIVDSAMDRLDLKRFVVNGDKEAEEVLNRLWRQTELSLDSDDAHEAALVCGESYVVAWPGKTDLTGSASQNPAKSAGQAPENLSGQMPEAYYNDPRLCHVEYDAERPRVKRWAAKWWKADEKVYRLTLYYPDRLEYYEARTSNGGMPESAKGFEPIAGQEKAENPTGVVPVFHLRAKRNTIVGELTQSVTELQNAVNKLIADMMVAAEYGAFRQRWVISNAELATLKNAPNEIWDLPAGDGISQDTQAGEFGATQLSNYFTAIDKLALAMAIISRTPKYYFFAQSGDPSGEALLAMEAPLNRKCARYIERFTPVWRELGAFLLRLSEVQVDPWAIEPVFDRPETQQPLTKAQARQFDVSSGVPLTTVLRREGWSEEEIAQMEADRKAERAAAVEGLAEGLLAQQRGFDQEDGSRE